MAQSAQSKYDRFDGYIPVAERVEKFYDRFPEGRIVTQIIEHEHESGFVLMRAEVFRQPEDASPAATGHAFEVRGESYVNKTSYIENAETSSVGRALALLGFEVKRGIASREEMEKATRMQQGEKPAMGQEKPARPPTTTPPPATAVPTQRPPVVEAAEDETALDAEILESALALGYDAVKVRKWVNQKYEVTGGLESLTMPDKREVLKIFREKAESPPAKTARR